MALFGGDDSFDLSGLNTGGGDTTAFNPDLPSTYPTPPIPPSGAIPTQSGGSGGGWLQSAGNWLQQNKGDIQSALKSGTSLANPTATTGGTGGSGVRTDVTAQAGMHQGQAGTLSDLYSALMARKLATQAGGSRASGGGLLGM
jgi:hypothetical protein